MQLTTKEQELLDGAEGPIVQKYFSLAVEWGRAMGAERMIPVESVHCSGISSVAGMVSGMPDEAIQKTFAQVKEFTSIPVKVPTATHVARMCMDDDKPGAVTPEAVAFQQTVIERARKVGIQLTWTCAPYTVGILPGKGAICSYTESSAVVFINSLLGARSTRNGSESSISAAITGLVPEFGVLRDEGRQGDFLIEVDFDLGSDLSEWGLAGYWAGEMAGLRTPVFNNLSTPTLEQGKQMSAALATGGGVTIFHIEGVTPEAPTRDAVLSGQYETLRYGISERKKTKDKLNTLTSDSIDYIVLGCPHATLEETRLIASMLDGRNIADHVRFEIWMPWGVKAVAERSGYVDVIQKSGGHVLTDSCPSISRVGYGKRMVTNSVKQAHYIQGMIGHEVAVGSLPDVIEASVSGTWRG